MLKKEDIKMIIKVGFTLFAITAVAALVLGFVNGLTEPVIEANTAKKQEIAMQKVLPDATAFSPISYTGELVSEISEGKNTADETVGYAVMVEPVGYGGEISMAVGVDTDGVVTGVDIISQSETAGLGANCTKEDFKNQFIGKEYEITVTKNGAQGNSIDAISSATITSKAVTLGVNTAIKAVNELKEGK